MSFFHYVIFLLSFPHLQIQSFSLQSYLIVDFDGTCTIKDTTTKLHKIALLSLLKTQKGYARKSEIEKAWIKYEDKYFATYDKVKREILSESSEKVALEDDLKRLDDVSTSITHEISNHGILSGIPQSGTEMKALLRIDDVDAGMLLQKERILDDHNSMDSEYYIAALENIKADLVLRVGCVRAICHALQSGWTMSVLSINWSPPLIDAILLHPVIEKLSSAESSLHEVKLPSASDIWANQIDANGVVDLKIPGAMEKKHWLNNLRTKNSVPNSSASATPFIVYVGDSATDLLALLEADIGILVGKSDTVMMFAKRWEIGILPLSDLLKNNDKVLHPNTRSSVWMTEEWREIEVLLGSINDIRDDHAKDRREL